MDRIDTTSRYQSWANNGDFLGACLCHIFGMAHFWKFPYLVYTHGGGTFFVAYVVCFLSLGVPLMLLELTLGQFSGMGPVSCWGFCPLFSGCGISMVIVSFITGVYYAVFISWSMLSFVGSVKIEAPWIKCGNWSKPTCSEKVMFLESSQCPGDNGLCTHSNRKHATYICNYETGKKCGVVITLPAYEYFDVTILGYQGQSIDNPGTVHAQVVLTLLLIWTLVWVFLIKGIHISAKMLIRTMLVPIVIFITLAAFGLAKDVSKDGIHFYFHPEINKLFSAKIWDEAARRVLFTLSAAYGTLIALCRYNDFHYNICRDIIIISVVETFVSFAVGVILFAFLDFVAQEHHLQRDNVTPIEPSMAFKIMPLALTNVYGTTFWCALFFLMLVFLGLGSLIIYIETVICSLIDFKPEFTRTKFYTITAVCIVMFLLGVPMTTRGGKEIVDLLDEYCTGTNLYIIILFECIAVGWVYGTTRFFSDVDIMLGQKLCRVEKINYCLQLWFRIHWKVVTPGFVVLILSTSNVTVRGYADKVKYPKWTDHAGWVIMGTCTLSIPLVALYRLICASGSLTKRLQTTTSPSAQWGPTVMKHRFLVKKYLSNLMLQTNTHQQSQRSTEDLDPTPPPSTVTDTRRDSAFTDELTEMSTRQSISTRQSFST